MRTITEINRLDARLKAASKCVKFIKNHINRKLGIMLQDVVDDIWSNSY